MRKLKIVSLKLQFLTLKKFGFILLISGRLIKLIDIIP